MCASRGRDESFHSLDPGSDDSWRHAAAAATPLRREVTGRVADLVARGRLPRRARRLPYKALGAANLLPS